MFAEAVARAARFTFPVISTKLLASGEIECGCATFVVLNAEGWVLTAAHVVTDHQVKQEHDKLLAEYRAAVDGIERDTSLNTKQRRRSIAKLRYDPRWIAKMAYWWGDDRVRVEHFFVDLLADIGLTKLIGLDTAQVPEFPVFRGPEHELRQGASLCRLGFPFHRIAATFDEAADVFRFPEGTLPLTRFAMDGLYTRTVNMIDQSSGRRVEFIETSTPGLRGQSGGPSFDVEGRVCGLQSRTINLALGFSPTITRNGREIEEHQFINLGLGVHAKEILAFLGNNGVRVAVG